MQCVTMIVSRVTKQPNKRENIMAAINKAKRNSKLQVTLNQWVEILRNEMAYSEDLRRNDVVEDAKAMIEKIKGMMA